MAVIIRTSSDRIRGLENDTSSNCALRVYIVKGDTLCTDDAWKANSNYLTDNAVNFIKEQSKIVFNAIENYFTLKNQSSIQITRGQLFISKEDDFYSLVFLFKISKPRAIQVSELRYYVITEILRKSVLVFHINNYEIHKNVSTWDDEHVSEGPYENFTSREFSEFVGIGKVDEGDSNENLLSPRKQRRSGNKEGVL